MRVKAFAIARVELPINVAVAGIDAIEFSVYGANKESPLGIARRANTGPAEIINFPNKLARFLVDGVEFVIL